MTLTNHPSVRINLSDIDIMKHIHRNHFINMGEIKEENIFLEAEETPPEPPKDNPAPKTNAPTPPPEVPAGTPPKPIGAPPDVPSGNTPNPDDPFATTEVENKEDSILLDGLPNDEQYYVTILKTINDKLLKLKEVKIKLLNENDDKDLKLITRIDTVHTIFNRFIEKYDEYENPKVLIIKLQKITDTLIMFVSNYIDR